MKVTERRNLFIGGVFVANHKNSKSEKADFDSLQDRLINEPSQSPSIVLKTNLDPDNMKDENPYIDHSHKQDAEEERKLEAFFDGDM